MVLVPVAYRLGFVALDETLQAIFPDGLQHPEARLTRFRLNLPQQALVDERHERVEHVQAQLTVRVADGHCAFDRAATDEDREPPEESLLCRIEKVVAPVDRPAQRALSLRHVTSSAREKAQALLEARQDRLRREDLGPSGGQLDRQWQAVQPRADRSHRRSVLAGEPEVGPCRAGALDEQGDRVVPGKRLQ